MRLFIFATLLACGDTKTTTTTTVTTVDQLKTSENSTVNSAKSTETSSLKVDDQVPSVKEFVQKSIETSEALETSDSNSDTTNITESKE